MLRSSCTSSKSSLIGSPETRASRRSITGVNVYRHGNIGQAAAGEDLEPGAVRDTISRCLPAWSGAGAAMAMDADLLLRGVVDDFNAPDLQSQDARRTRLNSARSSINSPFTPASG